MEPNGLAGQSWPDDKPTDVDALRDEIDRLKDRLKRSDRDQIIIGRIENLIRASGKKRRGERSNRDRAAKALLEDFHRLIGKEVV